MEKLYVWYFKPGNEFVLSSHMRWSKSDRHLYLYCPKDLDYWRGATFIASHQFEYLGAL